jgi:hypothetical protein
MLKVTDGRPPQRRPGMKEDTHMTPLVWANIPLALAFILAVIGIPLWLTFTRPQREPDFSEARAYLAAKAAA